MTALATESLVHRRFAEQARRHPDAVALVSDGEALTYGELARRVERLAGYLTGRGVASETLVAVAFDRSPESVVAMLSVLTAGGAYLPLDPGYPDERLELMLSDAGAPLMVSLERLAGAFPQVPGVERIFLDRLAPWSLAEGAAGGCAEPDNLAYVLYTSGSTGRPKGVEVTHRGLANLLPQAIERLGIEPGDRLLQLASLSFDASALEIFSALTAGAALHLVRQHSHCSGEALGALLAERAVTHLVISPSLLHSVPAGPLPALRCVTAGGEACPASLVQRWAPGRRFLNAYGPTEATIFATAATCDPARPEDPPLGLPVAGAEAHLLDRRLQPALDGETAEIGLAGVGLARGYLGRPALTAERFVPHPAGGPGARLYRTGDLARREPDGGELRFAGRIDHQVKLRGVRIELGEIEATLGWHRRVREAVAAVHREGDEDRLVLYVVPALQELVPTDHDLRAFLAARLPEVMVPAIFVSLDALPLTASGKVDRAALPAPWRHRPQLITPYAPPRTATEEVVGRIWNDLLGLDEVGIHDELFDLGGHSLLAFRILARVREELGVQVPMTYLFARPTVAGLAAFIDVAPRSMEVPVPRPAPATPAVAWNDDLWPDEQEEAPLR